MKKGYILALFLSTGSYAWTMPDVVIMPWVTEGAPSSFKEQNKLSMIEATKALATILANQNTTLEKLYRAQNPSPMESLAPKLSNFLGLTQMKDEFTQNMPEKNLLIQPFICSIASKLVVFSQISSKDRWTTLAVGSQSVSLAKNDPSKKYNLPQALAVATKSAFLKLKTRAPYPHNLKVSLHNESDSDPLRDPSCLNLILTEKILDVSAVNSDLDGESYGYLRQSGAEVSLVPARSTRKFLVTYSQLAPKSGETLKAKIKIIESVFGRRHPISLDLDLKLEESDGSFQFSGTEKMSDFLMSESKLLALDSTPEVIKKDRAWVYIDKGRAWGLKIGDRLETENGTIKGHIVAYYGPEMNLKSKDGSPIVEGAIVYVRKGQKIADKGLKFDWDKTTYPTAYPISTKK